MKLLFLNLINGRKPRGGREVNKHVIALAAGGLVIVALCGLIIASVYINTPTAERACKCECKPVLCPTCEACEQTAAREYITDYMNRACLTAEMNPANLKIDGEEYKPGELPSDKLCKNLFTGLANERPTKTERK